ncbi:MAG: M23 family metallopeptidase [Clostridia bacterium]|nr:M23 family metallopeptidase [Clostridia bacterium]
MYPYKSSFRLTSPQMPVRTVLGRTAPHKGIDLVGVDKYIYAVSDGVVVVSTFTLIGDAREFGNRVWIRDKNNKIVCYNHLMRRAATKGQTVKAGDLIGIEGSTGRSTNSHLHFEIRDRLGVGYNNFSAAEYIGIPNQTGIYNAARNTSGISVGDKVRVKPHSSFDGVTRGRTYTGGLFRIYYDTYDVIGINADRVVIGQGKSITAAVKVTDLERA